MRDRPVGAAGHRRSHGRCRPALGTDQAVLAESHVVVTAAWTGDVLVDGDAGDAHVLAVTRRTDVECVTLAVTRVVPGLELTGGEPDRLARRDDDLLRRVSNVISPSSTTKISS